jgi:hypothetical protein
MKKELKKKLSLHKETLGALEEERLETAVGGAGPTELSYCKSCAGTTCCATYRC